MHANTIEVRGHSRFERPASMALLFFAGMVDSLPGFLLVGASTSFFGLDPLLDWKLALTLAVSSSARGYSPARLGVLLVAKRSGRPARKNRGFVILRQPSGHCFDARGGGRDSLSAFLRRSARSSLLGRGKKSFSSQFIPPERLARAFVLLHDGPLADRVGGNPSFYSVPYEIGPPKRFLGHIDADWIKNSVRVSFEGPKTPMEFQSRSRRQAIHDCVLRSPF